jgi:hypothetical protein
MVSWCFWSTPLFTDEMDVPFWSDARVGIGVDGLVATFGFANGAVSDKSGNDHSVTTPQLMPKVVHITNLHHTFARYLSVIRGGKRNVPKDGGSCNY